MPNGIIQNVCECHCAVCERAYLGLHFPQKEAAKELRREGWRLTKIGWVCWDKECQP